MKKLLHSRVLVLAAFGAGAAALLFLLQIGRDYFLFTLNRIDLWITSIAFLFIAAGVIIGRSFIRKSPQQIRGMQWNFSRREAEVFQYLLSGMSNKEICEKLFIENSTLKTHVNRIYKKSGVKNRRELQGLNRSAQVVLSS